MSEIEVRDKGQIAFGVEEDQCRHYRLGVDYHHARRAGAWCRRLCIGPSSSRCGSVTLAF